MAESCQIKKLFVYFDLARKNAEQKQGGPAGLFRDFCQAVAKRVNDEFKAVGNVQF